MDDRLQELLKAPENKSCADCAEPSPTWSSTSWGVFICLQCAGVHRSLGVENSFVLSCSLDKWTTEQINFMENKGGNDSVNQMLEYCVPKTIEVPCGIETDRDTREKYIRAKYIDLLFCKGAGKSSNPPKRSQRKSSSSSRNSPPTSLREAGMVEFIGIIEVWLVEGRDLIIKDIVSSDPYCILSLGLQTRKSTTKKKTLNPKYNEMFSFSWDGRDRLKIEIFDHDDLSKDDHMGLVDVDLVFLKTNTEKRIECCVPVTHRKHRDRQQGELKLDVKFTPIN